MIGIHIQEVGQDNLRYLSDLLVFTDNAFGGLNHFLDIDEQDGNRSRKNQEKEEKDESQLLFNADLENHCLIRMFEE